MVAVPEWAQDLLLSAPVARLATADRAAQPLVVPVCFAYAPPCCYTAVDRKPKRLAARQLHRIRNIVENPRVALVVDEYHEDWSRLRFVMVTGRAALLDPGGERQQALGLLTAKYPQYRCMSLASTAEIVIRIAIEHAVCWRAKG